MIRSGCGFITLMARRHQPVVIRRCCMSTDSLVSLSTDPSTPGIAHLTMQNPPVNSLSLEMCQSISNAIKEAESDKTIQALVLQSNSSTIFSAGLDLMEMHKPDLNRLQAFWRSFQNLYIDLYGSRLACIAAIEGHAPAAGCMIALSCDYRIMTDNSKAAIGLNESKLGIAAPPWLGQQMIDTVGRRRAELALALGILYNPQQALEIGLVDEVVPNVRERSIEQAKTFAAIPSQARVASKMLVRKERIDTLKKNVDDDVKHFVGFITNDNVQGALSSYLQMLANKKKK